MVEKPDEFDEFDEWLSIRQNFPYQKVLVLHNYNQKSIRYCQIFVLYSTSEAVKLDNTSNIAVTCYYLVD